MKGLLLRVRILIDAPRLILLTRLINRLALRLLPLIAILGQLHDYLGEYLDQDESTLAQCLHFVTDDLADQLLGVQLLVHELLLLLAHSHGWVHLLV